MIKTRQYYFILSLVSALMLAAISLQLSTLLIVYSLISYWAIKHFFFRKSNFRYAFSSIFALSLLILILYKTLMHNHFLIPVGISFYTFRLIGFLSDVKNGAIEEMPEFLEYFLFLNFFPTFLSGPLVSYEEFFKSDDENDWYSSLLLLIRGIAKKVLISQYLLAYLNKFQISDSKIGPFSFIAYLFFNVVFITADLSAYTDIARSIGRFLGFNIPINFNLSLFAVDLADFWKRQHITFSNWLRRYIYFPVFFSANGKMNAALAASLALFVAFIFSGLWHVPSSGGILFGVMHFACFSLIIEKKRFFGKVSNFVLMWTTLLLSFWLIVFPFNSISKNFLRIEWAQKISIGPIAIPLILSVVFLLMDLVGNYFERKRSQGFTIWSSVLHSLLIILSIVFYTQGSPTFLYFSF